MGLKYTLLFLLCFNIIVCDGQNHKPLKVGDVLPDFELISIMGDTFRTEDCYGKVTLINVFATWCKPCLMELPLLNEKIWEKHKDKKNFNLIIIGRQQTDSELSIFQQSLGMDMPFFADRDSTTNKFAVRSIPRNYIIDKDGNVYYASVGYSEESFNAMKKALETLLRKQ